MPRAPRTLIETTRIFRASDLARDWFGDEFVDHFAATREWEWRQWQDAVTDWELQALLRDHLSVPRSADRPAALACRRRAARAHRRRVARRRCASPAATTRSRSTRTRWRCSTSRAIVTQVYESLVNRDREFALEPSLAVSWQAIDAAHLAVQAAAERPLPRREPPSPPTTPCSRSSARWRRTRSARSSSAASPARARSTTRRSTSCSPRPTPCCPRSSCFVGMMSKAWATKHGVLAPQDYNAKQETYAVRNANGTGPYKLKSYESDNRTVLVAHDGWWGKRGNVDEAIYIVIPSDATRLAALASGQVDFVIDPPFQDVGRLKRDAQYRIVETTDIGTQYLGFDQARDTLRGVDGQGAQSVQGPARAPGVHARDRHRRDRRQGAARPGRADRRRSCRSSSTATTPRSTRGSPYDPAAARALLKEAGYPDGFGVTLDCVAITWRAAVCQAIAGMLAQVGVKVTFQSAPTAQFFPKLTQATSSFFEFGWTPTTDAWAMLNATVRSYGAGHGHVQRRPLLEPEARRDRRRDPRRAGSREAARAGRATRSRSCTPTCR